MPVSRFAPLVGIPERTYRRRLAPPAWRCPGEGAVTGAQDGRDRQEQHELDCPGARCAKHHGWVGVSCRARQVPVEFSLG
jgi:hypothetical protein